MKTNQIFLFWTVGVAIVLFAASSVIAQEENFSQQFYLFHLFRIAHDVRLRLFFSSMPESRYGTCSKIQVDLKVLSPTQITKGFYPCQEKLTPVKIKFIGVKCS